MVLLGLRHQPSGENARFSDAGLTFAEYVQRMRDMLERLHAGQNEPEMYVEGNAPFDLPPAGDFEKGKTRPCRRGVLLVHGLSDSPYHMRHLAAFFQRNGFRVMALLLPGHGTQPGDLLHMRWQEWAKTVAWGAERLAEEADEIYLAGFSAGAALSVLHASGDERVRGLFLFSPALAITSRARWANLHKLWSWLLPRRAWVGVMQDRDPYKYESFCLNAAAQMRALTRSLPRRGIDIPVFAAASADDATVDAQVTWDFMRRATHPASRLVWYSTARAEGTRVEWVNSAVPEQRILSSAHTAVVMPPDDPHYGRGGDYANCLHYHGDTERYVACNARGAETWLGEVNEANLSRGPMRRLMFNPHYAQMEASMQRFLESLP